MKILLVEDNPDDLFLARRELQLRGHVVIGAENGVDALELYAKEQPDIVITDIYMPGMDGFALTRAIQQRAAPRWQPVMFLSGHRDDDLQIKALQVGADAYIVKPVSVAMLEAKLHVIQRLLAVQRESEVRALELERYYAAEEEDKRVAQHLIQRLVSAEKLDDPAIRYWVESAALFSGDLVAAARTPGNQIHVLLADGTGHGLSASLNVLPLIAPFYRMTEKGFGIDAIVREMNAKIKQLLPEERFVAATLAAIDPRDSYVRVWNGGNPEPVMLDGHGHAEHVFALRHPPLGILEDDEFEASTETHAVGADSQMIMYSDGLIDAENAAGEMFGFERLANALVNAVADRRVESVVQAVHAHLAGRVSRDDMSLLVVGCRDITGPREFERTGASPDSGANADWRFSLRLGAAELRRLDVIPLLLELANQFDSAKSRSGELFVILSELFNNALDHGLLGLDSRIKLGPDGMDAYLNERGHRLAHLVDGLIEIELEEFPHAGQNWMRIAMRDSGEGFDHRSVLQSNATSEELPFGRGLGLIRSMASSFEFNEAGNIASVVIQLTDHAAETDGNSFCAIQPLQKNDENSVISIR